MTRDEFIMFTGAIIGGIVSSLAFAFVLWLLGIVG